MKVKKMKAAQVKEPNAPFELVETDVPAPAVGEVLIRIEACGICHSDAFVKTGAFPGLQFPRTPGHEVVGKIDAVGSGVADFWAVGKRVGVGWHGGHCGHCSSCRDGDFMTCDNQKITGISFDGGYAEYMVASQEALAEIPEGLSAVDAAPLLCAGITTYNSLRNSGARPGDIVAIQGFGGLGHLAVQYSSRMGFYTVVISGSDAKKELAASLGANRYVDSSKEDPVAVLRSLGGARVIMSTVPDAHTMTSIIDGLGVDGELLVLGATADTIAVSPFQLIMARRSIRGWPSGTPHESEQVMRFSYLTGSRAQVETYPLHEVEVAYNRMIANEARFRVVLIME